MPELVFFVGKGGVGKTTVSSAYAVRQAARHPKHRVLLVSTDPAHSLSDVFETSVGGSPRSVRAGSRRNLLAWEIDSERIFRSFVDENKSELVQAVENGSLFTADEVSSLLDTALPGMSEMGALLAIHEAVESSKYATIVVDTAPFGHTLRLFDLPAQFAKLLNVLELTTERDQLLANHFGGKLDRVGPPFIAEWRLKLQEIQQALQSALLFLVTTPEEFALKESIRCIRQLQESEAGIKLKAVVLNRVVSKAGRCGFCKTKAAAARDAQRRLQKQYKDAEFRVAEDPGFPIVGPRALKQFADGVFGGKAPKWKAPVTLSQAPDLQIIPTQWPGLSEPLTFVLGKGGVGKTTVSAALGFKARQTSKHEVEICSVDPAPSLDDIFETEVQEKPRSVLGDLHFYASELDSVALYKTWVAEMRADIESATSVRRSGMGVDLSYERQVFSELLEIVPPGLDEILAIFRIMDLARSDSRTTIIDMAPTGHALELLRTPERILVWARLLLKSLASHRKLALAQEAAVRIAELEVRARELSQALTGSGVGVYAVMLPELLPDRETQRLLEDLRELRIIPEAVFVNRVGASLLPPFGKSGGKSNGCTRCSSGAAWQSRVLSSLKSRLRVKTVYVIPAFDHGPAGKEGLREITQKLWRLS